MTEDELRYALDAFQVAEQALESYHTLRDAQPPPREQCRQASLVRLAHNNMERALQVQLQTVQALLHEHELGEAQEPRIDPCDLGHFAPPTELAEALGLNPARVESALRRHARRHPDCRIPVLDRRPTEPAYLYRVRDVLPFLQQLR